MSRLLAIVFLTSVALDGQTSGPAGEVRFHVTGRTGQALEFEVASLRTFSGREYASMFTGLVGRNIPYGTYRYELRSKPDGVHKLTGQIHVITPEVYFPLAAREEIFMMNGKRVYPAMELPRGFVRLVRVSGLPVQRSAEAWVRVDPVLGGSSFHVRLSESGEGRLYHRLKDEYVASVVLGGRLAGAQGVDFKDGQSLDPVNIAVDAPPTDFQGCVDSMPLPGYPPLARQARLQGDVVARFVVNQAGVADQVRTTGGPKLLQTVVQSFLSQPRFRNRCAGLPLSLRVSFRLSSPERDWAPTDVTLMAPDTILVKTSLPKMQEQRDVGPR